MMPAHDCSSLHVFAGTQQSPANLQAVESFAELGLKRLASAVRLRPWPPCFQRLRGIPLSSTLSPSPTILGGEVRYQRCRAISDTTAHGVPPGKELLYLQFGWTDERIWDAFATMPPQFVLIFQRKIKEAFDPPQLGQPQLSLSAGRLGSEAGW